MSAPALEARGLSKSFGGVRAAAEVSFAVPEGSLTAIIGPNGAGKTTLFNLMTNLFAADKGEVLFFGTPLNGLAPAHIAAMGLVRTFQSARIFPGMTTHENVLAGAHQHVKAHPLAQMLWLPAALREERALGARADALLELAGLSAYRDRAATELPIGAQKLLEIMRALMAQPRVLLLDEPAAGLNDSETAELATLLRALRESGVTVVVVEHNMSLVMGVAHEVIVLDAGTIVASGTPAVIQSNPRVVEAYVGKDLA
ncbi:MAG TPA: ABC transporter ATP-binding protein [Burkholderiales bacterium]|jgi:branched-chain amino acid transport system ATP-binding protein|nr:ABC transporter ATP-binding protein [Burkholderiales bacterium]